MADAPPLSDADIERLAVLIAESLTRAQGNLENRTGSAPARPWLPIPVRPEPSGRNGEAPLWSGAAQTLDGISPGRARTPGAGRSTPIAELSDLTRAAAAGKAPPPSVAPTGRASRSSGPRGRRAKSIEVGIGVSARHVHLSEADARTLFAGPLVAERPISQPGQFAATQTVAIEGPSGRIDGVRVVGPARGATQVELSRSDARRLGVDPPLAASGSLAASTGGVTLHGSAGSVALPKGVIIAARHLHLAERDAHAWGFSNGDVLEVRCGTGSRAVTFHGVLVRASPNYATELHLDVDEANSAAMQTGDRATILAWQSPKPGRARLITERDVTDLARRGESIPPNALLTPSAVDRARALGLRPK